MNDIKLRAVEPEDVDFMLRCEADKDSALWSDYRAPLSRNQLLTYALTYDADPFSAGQLRLIAENEKGEKIGIADLYDISEHDSKAFLGLTILPEFRGNGLAHKVLERLHALVSQRMGLRRIVVKISTKNAAAFHTFIKEGYKELAVLPAWHRIGNEFHDFHLLSFDFF